MESRPSSSPTLEDLKSAVAQNNTSEAVVKDEIREKINLAMFVSTNEASDFHFKSQLCTDLYYVPKNKICEQFSDLEMLISIVYLLRTTRG